MFLKRIFVLFLIGGISADSFDVSAKDFFLQTLLRTFETPISLTKNTDETIFSLEIMLENDVFTLDDALRLFIQQFLIAIFNDRIHLIPKDWERRFPAYDQVINEINNLLDLIAQRPLSQITMKHVRPLIKSEFLTFFSSLFFCAVNAYQKTNREENILFLFIYLNRFNSNSLDRFTTFDESC